jgi:uncharacterized cupredoxin-like copper-binding protein
MSWTRAILILVAAQGAHAQALRYVATDYAYAGPATARPGVNAITLVNHGRQLHHMVITRVPDTLSVSRLYVMMIANTIPPDLQVPDVGGPNAIGPGDSTTTWLTLEPGRYMLGCYLVAADGKLHLMHGMFNQLDVSGTPLNTREPATDVEIAAREYSLIPSHPLRAGMQTLRFRNAGTMEHDLQLAKLEHGVTAERAARRIDGDTTVAAGDVVFMGGVSGLQPGHTAVTRVRLAPGRYLLYCWVPGDQGVPHYRHGMLTEVRVP